MGSVSGRSGLSRRIACAVFPAIAAVCLAAHQSPAAPPAAPFVQTFATLDDVRAAWTMSSWANANRSHSADNVPDRRSRLLLNHWSGNIPTFGGPAPTDDAIMQVDWVYYSPDYKDPAAGSLQ